MEQRQLPRLLSVKQLAKVTPYSVNTIRIQCAPKAKTKFPIKCKRIAGKLYFNYDDVVDFLENA